MGEIPPSFDGITQKQNARGRGGGGGGVDYGRKVLSQVRPNKLFPQKNARPEMAQKERKKGPKKNIFCPT
jgi:hypothetical protein